MGHTLGGSRGSSDPGENLGDKWRALGRAGGSRARVHGPRRARLQVEPAEREVGSGPLQGAQISPGDAEKQTHLGSDLLEPTAGMVEFLPN